MMDSLKRKVEKVDFQHRGAKEVLKSESEQLEKAREKRRNVEEALAIVQAVAAMVQEQAHRKIASVVSRCLEAVFDDPYEFVIDFEEKRGKTEAKISFERRGMKVDPMSASGGGVIDVASFALRLSCLTLTSPQRRKLLILDEPFRFVSRDYRPKIKGLVEQLSEEMGIQFVMVTHDPALVAGTVVEIT